MKIEYLMSYGRACLERGGEGKVHSVYRRTINLLVGGSFWPCRQRIRPSPRSVSSWIGGRKRWPPLG